MVPIDNDVRSIWSADSEDEVDSPDGADGSNGTTDDDHGDTSVVDTGAPPSPGPTGRAEVRLAVAVVAAALLAVGGGVLAASRDRGDRADDLRSVPGPVGTTGTTLPDPTVVPSRPVASETTASVVVGATACGPSPSGELPPCPSLISTTTAPGGGGGAGGGGGGGGGGSRGGGGGVTTTSRAVAATATASLRSEPSELTQAQLEGGATFRLFWTVTNTGEVDVRVVAPAGNVPDGFVSDAQSGEAIDICPGVLQGMACIAAPGVWDARVTVTDRITGVPIAGASRQLRVSAG